MAERFWKWKEFKFSRAHDLDLGSGHTAYRRASLIDLYLCTKFHSNRRNFLWTDGRTFSPSNIIRSTFGSQPKNESVKLFYITIRTACCQILNMNRAPQTCCPKWNFCLSKIANIVQDFVHMLNFSPHFAQLMNAVWFVNQTENYWFLNCLIWRQAQES